MNKRRFLNHIVKIQNILKLWKLRNLTIKRRIVVFESLAISKLIRLALVNETPTSTISLLTKKHGWNLYGKRQIQKLII